MLLSRLSHMSIGPLWKLKGQPDQPEQREPIPVATAHDADTCTVCGQPWQVSGNATSSLLMVLAAPITVAVQQQLLDNCLFAAGWSANVPTMILHSACFADVQTGMQMLAAQLAAQAPEMILVVGHATAVMLPADLGLACAPVVIHHPSDMLANPLLKADVWATLYAAKFDSSNSSLH